MWFAEPLFLVVILEKEKAQLDSQIPAEFAAVALEILERLNTEPNKCHFWSYFSG